MQDKAPQVRDTAGSREPSTARENAEDKPKKHGSEKRQTAHVSARVPQYVKAGLERIEEETGWSESYTVAKACEAYLENDLGKKFGLRLAAIVTDAIEKGLQQHSNRQTYLAIHGYYAAEESRIITTKVLRYLFGEETEIYNQLVKQARKDAYTNIKRPLEEKV